jgi:hypothetical protein
MVNSRDRSSRGGSTVGCVFSLVIFVAAIYYGINIGRPWFRYYQLVDEMRVSSRLATSLTDAVIKRRLAAKVEELNLPPEANKFTITRVGNPRKIVITTTYSEQVSLPLFHHTFIFTPTAEESL